MRNIFLKETLFGNANFVFEKGIYQQVKSNRLERFQELYLQLRQHEGRVYSNDEVKRLPNNSRKKEWVIRKASVNKLITYLRKRKDKSNILEVGCGNGWLSNQIAERLRVEVCGIDILEAELVQAARLFNSDYVSFANVNIMESAGLPSHIFDIIVMAGSIQYFPSIKFLLQRLFALLTPTGEIHILDSPICYSDKHAERLAKRSSDYFDRMNASELSEFYHYHTFKDLMEFDYEVLLNPKSLTSIIWRRILRNRSSPYPWIKIIPN